MNPHEDVSDIPEAFRLSTYQYELPTDLVAQHPASERDRSRLLVLERATGRLAHHSFRDLVSLLEPSDVVVINETKVTPALLVGRKRTGGKVELLILDPVPPDEDLESERNAVRACLVRSSKRLKLGTVVLLDDGVELSVLEETAPGRGVIRFPVAEREFPAFLEKHGRPPLPPYIKGPRLDGAEDRARYQTIYSKVNGSIAAPTAGLHFSERLLNELEERGISIVRILLHVGPGTFLPVRDEDVRLHRLESETYEISRHAADLLQQALKENRRIIAVGTTTVRALESAAAEGGTVRSGRGNTNLFITPGYSFKVIHGLVTNFHLPGTTLLMLVCAFGGIRTVMGSYASAVAAGYRFYSYGDACLIY